MQKHPVYSLFAEDNWTPLDALTRTAGVRYDDHNMSGGHVRPRLCGVYELSPAWLLRAASAPARSPQD